MTITFSRPSRGAVAPRERDSTPEALGALAVIRVAESVDAAGEVAVEMLDGAPSWSSANGAKVDPRTGRPYRVAPWARVRPTNLDALVHYFRGYLAGYNPETGAGRWNALTTAQQGTTANRLAALGAILSTWGWSSASEE